MYSKMYTKRIPIIMSAIRSKDTGNGLVPFLIENDYLPKNLPILFSDVITNDDYNRFQMFWEQFHHFNLAECLVATDTIGGKIPRGMWQYKDESEWAVENGIVELRDITFWKDGNILRTIAELSDQKIMDILNLEKNTDDDIRSLLLDELVIRGKNSLTNR